MHWYKILQAARRAAKLAQDGVFTAEEVAVEARVKATARSSAARITSAWLGKFTRWGYVLREGRKASGQGRPVTAYKLTRWGSRFRPGSRKAARPAPRRRRAAANEEEE